jgi:hypothetical protein
MTNCGITYQIDSREPVRLLDADCDRNDEFVTICGWCKKVRLEDLSWVEVEEAVQQLRIFDALSLPRLSHGMCEPCHDEQIRALHLEE